MLIRTPANSKLYCMLQSNFTLLFLFINSFLLQGEKQRDRVSKSLLSDRSYAEYVASIVVFILKRNVWDRCLYTLILDEAVNACKLKLPIKWYICCLNPGTQTPKHMF